MKKKTYTKKGRTTAKNIEEKFDKGESVIDYFDTEYAIRRINLDMPEWALRALERESNRRGITRQALIKTSLIDMLDSIRERKTA